MCLGFGPVAFHMDPVTWEALDTCDVCLGFRCTWPASFPARRGEWTEKVPAGLRVGSMGPGPLPRVWGPQCVLSPQTVRW